MRTAFAMVRKEHGPDAVILSNRMVDEGVEIVAATNYDESLVQRTLEGMRPQPLGTSTLDALESAHAVSPSVVDALVRLQSPAEAAADYFHPRMPIAPAAPAVPVALLAAAIPARTPGPISFAAELASVLPPAPQVVAAAAKPALLPSFAMALPAVEPASAAIPAPVTAPTLTVVADNTPGIRETDQHLMQMRAELASMREMIEREMHRLTDERLRGSPARAQTLALMEDYGFDAGITRDIALQIPADTEMHRARGLMLGLLSKRLPITRIDPLEDGGVIALVGPTGAGKTTTIAKLAATYAARHNARDVALVTTDTVRVGGREQLHSYGRQLGIAVHEADGDVSLAHTLGKLRDYKLVLIDTAGLGQRDKNLVAQLNWLHAAGQVHTLLVLPANSHYSDLDEVVRRFKGANPHGVILTKIDETGRLGSALSVIVDHQLPMAWITDGQCVPTDLHRAQGANLVLRLDQLRRDADQPHLNAARPTGASHVA